MENLNHEWASGTAPWKVWSDTPDQPRLRAVA
jgi:hypothetical protein